MKHFKIITMLMILVSFLSTAQIMETKDDLVHGNEHKGTSRLTLGLGHTHVSEGKMTVRQNGWLCPRGL